MIDLWNNFRKRTFPPSIEDISWRHNVLEAQMKRILAEIDKGSRKINALSDFVVADHLSVKNDNETANHAIVHNKDNVLKLPYYEFFSRAEFDLLSADMVNLRESAHKTEKKILEKDEDALQFLYEAFCIVCCSVRPFLIDYNNLGDQAKKQPYFRERLVCQNCNLNNRMRAAFHLLRDLSLPNDALIYTTEQKTDLFFELQKKYPLIVGSEFLADGTVQGKISASGIRHEDATSLSFSDNTFHALLSFECLEHIPKYRTALSEFSRVLKPGGNLLLTAPFNIEAANTLVRAVYDSDGSIKHLEKPEYHGDPINSEDILCFYHFGWNILPEIRECGFSSASIVVYSSSAFGYLGGLQSIIMAKK